MTINFDEIDILNVDAGGGNIYHCQNQPFTGTIVEYKNNILAGEITVVNGSTQGRVALYYNNGQIMEEFFEKNNRLYGIYKEWDEDGNLTSQVDCGPEPND